jgi:hypothetical protein
MKSMQDICIMRTIGERITLEGLGVLEEKSLVDSVSSRAPVWPKTSSFKFKKLLMEMLLSRKELEGLEKECMMDWAL